MSLYFIIFAVACGALLLAGFIQPVRIYQFPYFMAAVFAAFIAPQVYGLLQVGWGGAYLDVTILMAILTLAVCYVGYQFPARPGLLQRLQVPLNPGRLFHGGLALVVIGTLFMYKFNALPEDEIDTSLTGIGTVYLFFAGLIYPGFAICFYCALKERRTVAWVVSVLSAVIPLQVAIFYGRREPTVLFILSLGMSYYFLRGKTAPRWSIAAAIVGAALVIPAIGQYRTLAREDPLEAIKALDFKAEFGVYFDEDGISEVKNAAALIAATQAVDGYDWGAGYWNRIVFRFVPAQFLGKEFKDSLMIGGQQQDLAEFVEQASGYRIPGGSTVTGLGDTYYHFGYFGCLFFAAMAYLFKNLWTAANQEGGTMAQILYIQITTSAMRALTHQTMDFLPGLIYSGVFIGLVALYARERGGMPKAKIWKAKS